MDHHIHNKRGQSLVEFALILPLLLLILVGVFDMGRAFFALITIENAAREGARYGSLHPNDSAGMVSAATGETAGSGIVIGSANVSVSCPDIEPPAGSCDRGQAIRVTVSYQFTPLVSALFPWTVNMSRYVEMAVP